MYATFQSNEYAEVWGGTGAMGSAKSPEPAHGEC